MSPNCDPELVDSKLLFLHDTLAHDIASPYQVWLQMLWTAAEEISSRWTFTETLNLFCDPDHNRAIQPFHKTIHLVMTCHQTKFSCTRISSSNNIAKSHILIILPLIVTLTLSWYKMVEQFRKYWADTIRHTGRTTDGQSDSNIHTSPPPPIGWGEGYKKTN